MVAHLLQDVTEYEENLRRNQYVPRFPCGRRMLRDDGGPNSFFFLFSFLMYLTAPRVSPVVPALFRDLPCHVRPRSILIIFRLAL